MLRGKKKKKKKKISREGAKNAKILLRLRSFTDSRKRYEPGTHAKGRDNKSHHVEDRRV